MNENDIHLLIQVFPSQTRDFIFCTRSDDDEADFEIVHPMNLLGLDLAVSILERFESRSLSLVVALCRLLVPCLEYRGNRRHLVVEEWSDQDLRGETLFEGIRTVLSRDLAVEQAEEYRVVTTGEEPPEGSLAKIFWDAHTELPDLQNEFRDADMSNFVNVLYHDLVPAGAGRESVSTRDIRRRVLALWSENFQDLDLRAPVRQRRRVFKRVLAATVRLASQLNGYVAKALVFRRLDAPRDEETLTSEEASLLELRYGGSRALRDINIGLLFGCGPLFAELINDFALAHVAGSAPDELTVQSERLRHSIYLLGQFRCRRKAARATERRDGRLSRADRLPGRREAARNQADDRAREPSQEASSNEEWQIAWAILPHLKPRDAERLRAFLEARGVRRVAAEALGLDVQTFNQQWRQTVRDNVNRKIEELRVRGEFNNLLNERYDDGEEDEE